MKRRGVFTAGAAAAVGLTAAAAGVDLAHADTSPSDITPAWTETPFTYTMQKPWDLDLSERYKHESGVHTMWVYDTDKPHDPDSDTDPRTEMRWNEEYTTGEHMWDADVYVPSGVDGPCVAQILRVRRPDGTPSTDIQLRAYNLDGGTLRRYSSGEVVATGIYDTWLNVKMAHNAGAGSVDVFVNDEHRLTVDDRGPADRHFKNGVYGGVGRMEARFRNIRYWTR
ncbi:MAG: cinnamyl alcohol dehydrogenase [Stackebrandtia sp.]